MDIPEFVRKKIEEEYPELGEVTIEYLAAANHLGGVKMFLNENGLRPRSGLITHVGKIERGILFGITMRGLSDPEGAYESYKEAQHKPVLLIF